MPFLPRVYQAASCAVRPKGGPAPLPWAPGAGDDANYTTLRNMLTWPLCSDFTTAIIMIAYRLLSRASRYDVLWTWTGQGLACFVHGSHAAEDVAVEQAILSAMRGNGKGTACQAAHGSCRGWLTTYPNSSAHETGGL